MLKPKLQTNSSSNVFKSKDQTLKSTMPGDSRRLQGPESAFSYTLLEKKDATEGESVLATSFQKILIGANECRQDKRKPIEARPLCNLHL